MKTLDFSVITLEAAQASWLAPMQLQVADLKSDLRSRR
jgi:hypothetical protein